MSNNDVSLWAVVELFGHKTLAGRITKSTEPFPMLRIDIPATSDYPEYTVEHGVAAIYGITYVSEQVARHTAEALRAKPINIYSPELVTREQFDKMEDKYREAIDRLRALPSPKNGDREEDEEDEEDETRSRRGRRG